MKKTKNAFTLIELLAVIVILAIIALIATPIILGIVEDAKKDAFMRSVELLVSTTDIDIANKSFEENYTYEITDGNISDLEVSVKNIDGMNGTIIYNVEGKEMYAIHNGVYCVKKTNKMEKAEISDYVEGDCEAIDNSTSASCFAFQDGTITDYYDYEENDSSKKACPREVVIPQKINGVTVTEIGSSAFVASCAYDQNWNYICPNQIISVQFPSSLTKIGDFAFLRNKLSGELDLSYLTNLTSIGEKAFVGNSDGSTNQIISIKFPSTLESIGDYAFSENALSGELDLSHLTNLTSVSGFDNNEITSVKLPTSATTIGESAFKDNKLSGELDLSYLTNLTSIGRFAFTGRLGGSSNVITSIKLPTSVTTIGENAFEYNALSGELDLSNTSITSIGNYAFQGNSNVSANQITSIKLPTSVTTIGRYTFAYNKIIGELDLSMYTNLTIIGEGAFASDYYRETNKITSIKLSNSVVEVNRAFESNLLISVTFYGRSNLTGISYEFDWASDHDESNSIFFVNE